MLSADGRCKTFDARANGYARGEGVGAVVMRAAPLASAVVLYLGSRVRSDGKSASLTAPNGMAQARMLAALQDANPSVASLALNEAHGTGTALGDPIEAGSLVAAVLSARDEALAVGGVKANIGHAEPAAGMTGLLKLAICLQGGEAAPNAQLRSLNPLLGTTLRGVACALPVQLAAVATGCGIGGVSSFGYSGTIAHAVLRHTGGRVVEHASVLPPLVYRRRPRAFAWQALTHPSQRPTPLQTYRRSFTAPAALLLNSGRPIIADTPLMEAGIKSQQAVRLAARLRELSGIALSATLIFEHPTPRSIAARLTSTASDLGDADAIVALVNEFVVAGATIEAPPETVIDVTFGISVESALPASTYQEHFVLLHLLQPQTPAYAMPMVLELPSAFTPCSERSRHTPLVRAALQHLVHRHAVLRTFYALDQGSVFQVIMPAHGLVVPLQDSARPDWTTMAGQDIALPFCLTEVPPIRAILMHSSAPNPACLLLNVHHVATDFTSNRIIHNELHQIYEALLQGRAPWLRTLSVEYADYAIWQQRRQSYDASAATLEWWRAKLEGVPTVLELPLDSPRPAVQAACAGMVEVSLGADVTLALRRLCAEEHVADLSSFLAGWAVLMKRLSGQDEVRQICSNRHR
jgi:hypothetical protein